MKLTKKQRERMYELEELSVNRFLDKSDWNISDWLEDDEWHEYKTLRMEDDPGWGL